MKLLYTISILLLGLLLYSCEDFEEVNTSPNDPQVVSSNFVLTYVLSETAKFYETQSRYSANISGAMQYIQRGTEFNSNGPNFYAWSNESWSGYYTVLRNIQVINDKAVDEVHPFFEGVSLVMRAFVFGFVTDLYGDIPFSESLSASEDVFFPKYDSQKDVYVGVLNDLKKADGLLSNVDASVYPIASSADIFYGGDPVKWRRFANALRLRYTLRLHNKESEIGELDLAAEFKDAAEFAYTSNADNAVMEWIGATSDNAAPGGSIRSSNPNFAAKPAVTLTDILNATGDPRLHRWAQPVLKKWDDGVDEITDSTFTNIFGEVYDVTYMPRTDSELDTAMFVGIPIGLPSIEAINYNNGDDPEFFNPEQNPHISFLHDRYRMNKEDLINVKLMTYAEVQFILAEAALLGDLGYAGNVEDLYLEGIKASMDEWRVFDDAVDFDFDVFYAQDRISLASSEDQQEQILTQKWIASWLKPESWFDWRRTGYPTLEPGEVTQFGKALPIRFVYPSPNLDPSYLENYEAAIERLEATNFVPVGQSKDHAYSKMWLLQGTNKPW